MLAGKTLDALGGCGPERASATPPPSPAAAHAQGDKHKHQDHAGDHRQGDFRRGQNGECVKHAYVVHPLMTRV
jgi:hypothetical protein